MFRMTLADGRVLLFSRSARIHVVANSGSLAMDWRAVTFRPDRDEYQHLGTVYYCESDEMLSRVAFMAFDP
jgi:hypothetical protein